MITTEEIEQLVAEAAAAAAADKEKMIKRFPGLDAAEWPTTAFELGYLRSGLKGLIERERRRGK